MIDNARHRRIILTPHMHAVLLDVLEFACSEHPGDIDARRLKNIAKAAKYVAPTGSASDDRSPDADDPIPLDRAASAMMPPYEDMT